MFWSWSYSCSCTATVFDRSDLTSRSSIYIRSFRSIRFTLSMISPVDRSNLFMWASFASSNFLRKASLIVSRVSLPLSISNSVGLTFVTPQILKEAQITKEVEDPAFLPRYFDDSILSREVYDICCSSCWLFSDSLIWWPSPLSVCPKLVNFWRSDCSDFVAFWVVC